MGIEKHFRVRDGEAVRLKTIDPASTLRAEGKDHAKAALGEHINALRDLQYALFAEGRQSLLVVLQGRDAGGKDGTIRALSPGFNPQGCRVMSFKEPSTLERAHDFLWRVHPHVPKQGAMAIFNRSHYEDVLVVRVKSLAPERMWRARYEHINAFERLITDSGTRVIKFFLHISKEEQLERFAKRLDDPVKQWKISEADYTERAHWDAYREAYEEVFLRCSPAHAPWYVIPADKKWYRNYVVARIIRETLEDMAIKVPKPTVDIADIAKRYAKALKAQNGED